MPCFLYPKQNYHNAEGLFNGRHCITVIFFLFIITSISYLQGDHVFLVQGDQLNMAMIFCYLGNSDLARVHVYSSVHWTSQFLLGTRKTRPCLIGHPVPYKSVTSKMSCVARIVLSQSRVAKTNSRSLASQPFFSQQIKKYKKLNHLINELIIGFF